jgi:hypothetical protein
VWFSCLLVVTTNNKQEQRHHSTTKPSKRVFEAGLSLLESKGEQFVGGGVARSVGDDCSETVSVMQELHGLVDRLNALECVSNVVLDRQ